MLSPWHPFSPQKGETNQSAFVSTAANTGQTKLTTP